MPRRLYLTEQADKARRLATLVHDTRAQADLSAYAAECDCERQALEQMPRIEPIRTER